MTKSFPNRNDSAGDIRRDDAKPYVINTITAKIKIGAKEKELFLIFYNLIETIKHSCVIPVDKDVKKNCIKTKRLC